MYNLLMYGTEGYWNHSPAKVDYGRFLAYTHEAIAKKYQALGDDEINELKRLPTLFCYEYRVDDLARIGLITDIRRGTELTLTFEFDTAIPPIPPAALQKLYAALDISN